MSDAFTLRDLVHAVADSDAPLGEILLERADRILAKDGGRDCKRVLTKAEIDRLLAGEDS